MRVVTWNVNSLRARLARTVALIERHKPDVLCLQETKVTDETFPFEELSLLGYHAATHGQKGYNGVAILSREPLESITKGFPGDPVPEQSRAIAATVNGVRLINLYVVNGKSVDHPDYQLKLEWLDALNVWLNGAYTVDEPVLIVGDFNVAPEDIDVHDPELWRGHTHCTDAERERIRGLMSSGLCDLFRSCNPDDQRFSWWDYRDGAFHKGHGLRIDLALATPILSERCSGVDIDRQERKYSTGEGAPSDHAPVIVDLDWPSNATNASG